jgi:hypothetical protein
MEATTDEDGEVSLQDILGLDLLSISSEELLTLLQSEDSSE